MFYVVVKIFPDVRGPRGRQQTPVTQSSRPELSWSLEPANDLSGLEQLQCGLEFSLFGVLQGVTRLAIVENVLNFPATVRRTDVNLGRRRSARLLHHLVPIQHTSAQCAAGVTRSRRH